MLNLPDEILPDEINKIFSSSTKFEKKRKFAKKKPWFDELAFELRKECFHLNNRSKIDHSFRKKYVLTRNAYHKHLKNSEKIYLQNSRNFLVDSTLNKGMNFLFKENKKKSKSQKSSSISLSMLYKYSKELYDSNSSSTFPLIPSANDISNPFLQPFSIDEIIFGINTSKSKASSTNGLSPFSLKLISVSIAPLLLKVFNYSLQNLTFPKSWLNTLMFFFI